MPADPVAANTATREEWERAYDEAVQWRDWQTCDLLHTSVSGAGRDPRRRMVGVGVGVAVVVVVAVAVGVA